MAGDHQKVSYSSVSPNEDDDTDCSEPRFNLVTEAKHLFNIAIPTVIVQLATFSIFPMTASTIGRNIGSNELAGFSLATLSMNMTCLSIIMGTLTAAGTLQPRAMAMGRFDEVGLLAIRGYCACAMVLFVPVILLGVFVEPILLALGQDPVASHLASKWARIYVLGVPFVVLFQVTQLFLSAQHIVVPMVVGSAVGSFLFHPFALKFLVGIAGFVGSAFAVVSTQSVYTAISFLYLSWKKPHNAATWPGLTNDTIRLALHPRKMSRFLKLGLWGVLSFAEWWFWEVLCFMAGRLGVTSLCAHTVAYQIVPLSYMIPLGLSIGLAVRIGSTLPTDVHKAKMITFWCMIFAVAIGLVQVILLYIFQLPIIRMFTNDELVIEECTQIWLYACIHIFNKYITAINLGVLRALGLQWRSGVATVSVLWICVLPHIYRTSIVKKGGLVAIWKALPLVYLVLNTVLFLCYFLSDWQKIRADIISRGRRSIEESAEITVASTENMLLLLNNDESTLYGTTMLDSSEKGKRRVSITVSVA